MNNRTLFRLFALLLAIVMLLSSAMLAVGAEEAVDDNTIQTAPEDDGEVSESKVLRDDCWYIAYKNVTTYSIVRSQNAMNLVKAKLMEVQENFKKWTALDPAAKIDRERDHLLGEDAGADLDLITNASQLTNQEIIVGQIGSIGRQELEDRATELGIQSADFFVEVKEDGDIWIVGGSNTATTVAIDFCLNRVFDINIAERYICVKKGYSYVYHHEPEGALPSSEILDQGAKELEFVVSPYTMDDVFARLTFAKVGGWRIQNKYSFTKAYNDYGAAQMLALAVGELPDLSTEKLTYEALAEGGLKVSAPDGSYAIVYTEPFKIEFYTASGKLAQTVTGLSYAIAAGGREVGSVSLDIVENEPIYGSGQRFDNINQYGQKVMLYTTDVWENNESADSKWQSQVAVPLFTNVRGSGVFMNRNEYMVADIGNASPTKMTLELVAGLIDFYVFTTESIADSIGRYCEISGANAMPEDWTYGMIVCRAYPDFTNADKVYQIISKMEEYSLPWTGITVQGWSAYNEETHEELRALCEHVHALGKKVMISVTVGDFPGAAEMDAAIRDEAALPSAEKPEIPTPNYFMEYKTSTGQKHTYTDALGAKVTDKKIPNCDPEMLSIGLLDPESIQANTSEKAYFYIDLTNPEAVNWFFDEYWEYLLNDIGVDGVKIDGGFRIPDTAGTITMYDDGMALAGTHHWYPTAFSAMIWEKVSSKPDSGVCFVRGAGIGAQRSSYVAVADQTRILNRLQRQVIGMISSGLSGMAFTTFDIGGSKYKDGSLAIGDDAPIFLRSLEIAAFSVSMQVAGEGTRHPYDYAEYDDGNGNHPYAYVTELYKIYTMVHEALTPYLNECSEIACETGMPVVRHLVLQYANDENVYDIKDQYMLGDAFLVAPMVPDRIANNVRRNSIYLPEGEWLDLLSGETISAPEGGKKLSRYNVAQSQIPVFYNLNNTSETAADVYEEVQALLAAASAVEIP